MGGVNSTRQPSHDEKRLSFSSGEDGLVPVGGVSPIATDMVDPLLVETSREIPDIPFQSKVTSSDPKTAVRQDREVSVLSMIDEWQYLQALRTEIWSLRSRTREMRRTLRDMQDQKSLADDRLFQAMNRKILGAPPMPSSHKQKSIEELRQDCQIARDNYGPFEDDYNSLEHEMSNKEFRLTQFENKFYSRPSNLEGHLQHDGIYAHSPSFPIPLEGQFAEDSDGDNVDEDLGFHPTTRRYLSKQGDLDLLEERLDNVRDEKQMLEEEWESRRRFGRELEPEDQAWLNNAASEIDELVEKIRKCRIEVEDLKQICISQNLVDEDGEPIAFEGQEQAAFENETDLNAAGQQSEYVKYPMLLPQNPATISNFAEVEGIQPDQSTGFTFIRINEWILRKLRISPMDVYLLATISEKAIKLVKGTWEIEVLAVWYKDDTVMGARSFRIYTASYLSKKIDSSR